MKLAVDATYSLGRDLSGIGVYSRELLHHLAALQPTVDWRWLYRPHRLRASFQDNLPANASRGLLLDRVPWRNAELFHGLNQRLPRSGFPRQVATFHDLFVMTAEYSEPAFRARFTEQARRAAGEADRIIAVSKFTAGQVVNLLGVSPSRVTVIPHGVRALTLPNVTREKLILHVGALQKRKNLVRLVQAFDAVPEDWRLVLAGSDGYAAAEVHHAIADSKSRSRIIVTGYVSASELARWYATATIFAFPSLDEGFGMPVLEAMAAGVAVLASSGSAVGEVAGDAAVLIHAEAVESLAEGLTELVRNPELRNKLVQTGYEQAAKYTWNRTAAQTFAVYRELIPQLQSLEPLKTVRPEG